MNGFGNQTEWIWNEGAGLWYEYRGGVPTGRTKQAAGPRKYQRFTRATRTPLTAVNRPSRFGQGTQTWSGRRPMGVEKPIIDPIRRRYDDRIQERGPTAYEDPNGAIAAADDLSYMDDPDRRRGVAAVVGVVGLVAVVGGGIWWMTR